MRICEVLKTSAIIPELKGTNKEEVIDEMLNLFKNDSRVLDLKEVRNSVIERENIMSTGVGHGFGIPHCKTNKVTEILAAFAKTKEPIDFQALDGKPVNLLFLLIGKDNLVAPHIKLLSRISLLMNKSEVRDKLNEAKTVEEIYSIFESEENKIS
ncbi:MAG: PTS sugar transporter subunit IIA [Ignavibacteriae bacterium]|nr:PTS sugar transporter subunit IIA [Ignavibacteriota bacterium]MCB9210345.1 PTS sugar transporter subunit IIA [Ignavibacteriales bacterium]MCB9219150.1 PTS sugar transporter subunit IIA [Ignavibacteriales bacterium]MCB9259732.1 PTS sugar transporter subunit IIA [Ignavibacteriales bacterium]